MINMRHATRAKCLSVKRASRGAGVLHAPFAARAGGRGAKMMDEEGKTVNVYSIKHVRATTMAMFTRRLNIWTMLLHATAVDNVLVVTAYLDDVVYANLRATVLSSCRAF